MSYKSILKVLLLAAIGIFSSVKTNAQVVPDNTLGAESSSIDSIDDLRQAIEGGAIRGENLFHSFEQFAIQSGLRVDFTNPAGIENIFSRVTGGSASEILGTLGVEGSANLFLMNPNGIVFGNDAAIDVGGSFLATTAQSIDFNSGDRFSSSDPNVPSLEIDFPIGLSLGSNPGDINVNGSPNDLFIEIPSFKIVPDNRSSGLQVDSNNSISLIGGEVSFDRGVLKTSGGDIEIASIAGNENIELVKRDNWFNLNTGGVSLFEDINLENASIDASSEIGGNIFLAGKNIILDRGSFILSNSSADSNNQIDINASGLLEIGGSTGADIINKTSDDGSVIDGQIFQEGDSNYYSISVVGADLFASPSQNTNSTGNDVNINANDIRITDAGQIRTVSFSDLEGGAGDININAQNILVEGATKDGFITSVINSTTGFGSTGNNGNVDISTSILRVENGGRIKADLFGKPVKAPPGNLKIEAERIVLSDDNSSAVTNQFRTGLSTSPGTGNNNAGSINLKTQELRVFNADVITTSFAEKKLDSNVGDITVDAESIKVLDGGAIVAESAGGDSGNININARDIELNGTKRDIGNFSGGISSSTRLNSLGNGGNINIQAESLSIKNGALIRAISLGSGNAGSIDINANRIEIAGVDKFAKNPFESQRVSRINTDALSANGGNVTINSNSIELDNLGRIGAASIEGDRGGNISINTENLELLDRNQITASAGGLGDGGNITIDSDTVLGLENSDITANAVGGDGGNITIDADFIVGLEARSRLTQFSDITASSELGVDGTVTVNAPDNNLGEEAVVVFTNYTREQDRRLLEKTCLNPSNSENGKLIYVGRGGIPENPRNFFGGEEVAAIEKVPTEEQTKKNGDALWVEGDPIVNSNAVRIGIDGEQYLVAETKSEDVDSSICTRTNNN